MALAAWTQLAINCARRSRLTFRDLLNANGGSHRVPTGTNTRRRSRTFSDLSCSRQAIVCDERGLSVFEMIRWRQNDTAVSLCAFDPGSLGCRRTRPLDCPLMSLMPCFDKGKGFDESIIIARLLAGYGEIELQMCMCLIVVEGQIDTPIREIFEKRGAEFRIKTGANALETEYAHAGLLTELTEALADLDWCRQIRNQYSHCQWFWTATEGLCFVKS